MNSPATSVPELVRRFRLLLGSVFFLAAVAARAFDSLPALVVEMRSTTNGTAQLFYDPGAGLEEGHSVRAPVAATGAFQTLWFRLPADSIRALRFDPIDRPGTFSVRRIYVADSFGSVVRDFTAGDIVALNQIATRADSASEMTFTTPADAFDPILQLALFQPLYPAGSRVKRAARFAIQLLLALLVTAVVAAAVLRLRWVWVRAGRLLDRLAALVSDPAFLVLDRLAVGCYVGILALFTVAVSAGVHGSSMSLYGRKSIASGQSVHPIVGRGKPIRGDEWNYHTPAILNQVYRASPFSVETSALGPDSASLIANVPVWHITTIFRPQFWRFFLLPPAYGFSFYWQFKAMLLLGGIFSLLLLLTHSSRIALVGTLWYAWSAYTQWTYSWPSLLPEMIGSFCLTMCSLFYISTGRRSGLLAVAAAVCATSMINFALCAYIPHQIPLVWLGVFLCSWWLWARWDLIASRERAEARLVAGSAVLVTVAVTMGVFYLDARPALAGIANTVYPGRRSMPAGGYQLNMLGSHPSRSGQTIGSTRFRSCSGTSASAQASSGWRRSPCSASAAPGTARPAGDGRTGSWRCSARSCSSGSRCLCPRPSVDGCSWTRPVRAGACTCSASSTSRWWRSASASLADRRNRCVDGGEQSG